MDTTATTKDKSALQAPNTPKIRSERTQKILEIKQANPNLTTRQIGELTDCDHSHVVRVLQRHNLEMQRIIEFKENRADIFAGLQDRLLSSITEDEIKKAPVGSRILGACQIYDKERIERGLSTENVSYHVVTQDISKIDNEIVRLEKELARLQSSDGLGVDLGVSGNLDNDHYK